MQAPGAPITPSTVPRCGASAFEPALHPLDTLMDHLPANQPSRFRLHALYTLAAAVLCGSVVGAHAAGMNMVVTSNVASASPVTQNYSTATPSDLAITHTLSTTVTSYGSSAYGWVEGGAGVIRIDSTVHVEAAIGYVPPGYFLQQSAQNGGIGITDVLHVDSTVLAVGTPVDLTVTLSFAQIVTLSEAASMYLGGGYFATYAANAGNGASVYLTANGQDDVNATGSSAILHTFVGQYINLSESMSGGVSATYIDGVVRDGHADASHSAHFYVDSITPGVSLSADSGHDYLSSAASVPEPSSTALLLAGAGLIGWITRRRAQALRI